MTYYRLKTTHQENTFILQKSTYCYIQPKDKDTSHTKQPRSQSQLNTDDYNRSLRRAFSRTKALAFFNPDLTQFITLTYKGTSHTPHQVQQHIKDLVKQHNNQNPNKKTKQKKRDSKNSKRHAAPRTSPSRGSHPDGTARRSWEPQAKKKTDSRLTTVQPMAAERSDHIESHHRPSSGANESTEKKNGGQGGQEPWKPFKYIYVMEYQKRGSIHVHMIANRALETHVNAWGHTNVTNWKHGFSDVKTITDFDENFRPYLYLFKYMHKAERIGASFVHVSKNFDEIVNVDYNAYIERLKQDNALYTEDHEFIINDKTYQITKEYYRDPQGVS